MIMLLMMVTMMVMMTMMTERQTDAERDVTTMLRHAAVCLKKVHNRMSLTSASEVIKNKNLRYRPALPSSIADLH